MVNEIYYSEKNDKVYKFDLDPNVKEINVRVFENIIYKVTDKNIIVNFVTKAKDDGIDYDRIVERLKEEGVL